MLFTWKMLKMNQRDFAKLISFPNANKYMKYEQGKLERLDQREKTELIKNVCDTTCANPCWLEKELKEPYTKQTKTRQPARSKKPIHCTDIRCLQQTA